MCQLPAHKQTRDGSGFTLLEVMVAMGILVVGLMGNALLMANVYKMSVRSRYMAQASQLASEKLEDLNRWPVNVNNLGVPTYIDPNIDVPSGSNDCGFVGVTCVGSLTQDWGPDSIADFGPSTAVSYYDYVYLSTQNGVMTETYQTGGTNSTTVSFSPNGQVQVSANAPAAGGITFDRRWVIEKDQPVTGVRRITVLVTLVGGTRAFPVTFQMGMVRP